MAAAILLPVRLLSSGKHGQTACAQQCVNLLVK
jgi:hypothetical protein